MKTTTRLYMLVAGLIGGLLLLIGIPLETHAGKPWKSIAVDHDWDGLFEEAVTTSEPPVGFPFPTPVIPVADGPDGKKIYTKTFFLSGDANVLKATMSTTGDTHLGAAACFTCVITDPTGASTFCNPGLGQGAARCAAGGTVNVPGWVNLLKLPAAPGTTNCSDGGGGDGDCHDNNIHYEWCTPVNAEVDPGLYTVELWMATDTAGEPVFIEQAYFYLDETKVLTTDNVCSDPTP